MYHGYQWPEDQSRRYALLAERAAALMEGEPIADMANLSALIWLAVQQLNWAGFYRRVGDELVLGPFQGRPACVRIGWGKGVCGTAAAQGAPQLVADVHAFPGHIACDPDSRSELVLPFFSPEGEVLGVLDLDSPIPGRFGQEDLEGLLPVARLAAEAFLPKREAPSPAARWEWPEDSILRRVTPTTPTREIFQAVCNEIGRYYQPAGLKYTRSNRRLKWRGELLRCELGFWSSHSNLPGEWVNLEVVTTVFAADAGGMDREGLLPFSIRPHNFNVYRAGKGRFAEIIACIDQQLALVRQLESREGLERFLAELGDRPRRELQADGNLRQYLDRLDCRQIQEPVSIPAGVNTGSKERIG